MQTDYSPVPQNPPKDGASVELGHIELQTLSAPSPTQAHHRSSDPASEYRAVPKNPPDDGATIELGDTGSPQGESTSQSVFGNILGNMSEKKIFICIAVAVGIVALLLAIILPISFATLEHYEMGFKQRKSSGTVNTDTVYSSGRHAVGPDSKFKVFPADAHFENFHETVFTADRLQVSITGHFQYFLRPHQLKLLHKNFDIHYEEVLRNNAIDALKGKATLFATREYIRDRMRIETELYAAIRERLGGTCCVKDCSKDDSCLPSCKPYDTCNEKDFGLFADVRYLQLAELDIPGDLEERYLRALVLQEENEAEKFKQEAQIVRKETEFMVKETENKAQEISKNADANSRLIISKAEANSTATRERARTEGLKHLYSEISLTSAQHKSSFDYLNTLSQMRDVSLAIDYQTLIASNNGQG